MYGELIYHDVRQVVIDDAYDEWCCFLFDMVNSGFMEMFAANALRYQMAGDWDRWMLEVGTTI